MRVLLIVLSVFGIADSTFLVWDSLAVAENCGVFLAKFGIATCSTVTESAYGVLWGYPISIFGVVGYSSVFVLVLKGFRNEGYRKEIFVIALTGFMVSLYLTYVQWLVLDSWCFFCLVSAFLMTFILLTSIALLGNVSKYGKKHRSDLKQSLVIFSVVMVVVLVVFESVRGRMLYHAKTQPTAEELTQADVGINQLIGIIDEEFITLGQVNALAGAVTAEHRAAAFDYLLLSREEFLTETTLAEMITNQTTLRLFPPGSGNDEIAASTTLDTTTGTELANTDDTTTEDQALSTTSIDGETVAEGESLALVGGDEVTVGLPPDYVQLWDRATFSDDEVKFRAYLGFLERARAKNKIDLWDLYLAELRDKYDAELSLP
ncbi:hypothetical protein COTS27_01532 [Spirochaetota bacterium]|nr:hypothetical protein COTS27_01532 [Spirochaetota bacterium]